MRGAYLEPRKTVERSLEDQVRQRDRGLEWIADRIGQQAAAGEPTARLQFAGAKWVHENQHAQFLALRPERVEFWVRQFLAGNAAGNADAAKPEFLDRVLDLLRSEVGKLQRRRREADETIGMTGTELDQRLVLHFDQLFSRVALGAVPERVDAQRLDIDARLVHVREAVPDIRPKQRGCFERVIDQLRGVGNDAVRVHIDGLDPLTGDDDLPASMRMGVDAAIRTGAGSGGNLAVDKGDAGGAAGGRIGADRHLFFLPLSRPRIRRKPTMARSLCRRRTCSSTMVRGRGSPAGIRPIDARVGIGLAVRKGISRPDISSPEADTARGRSERTEG